MENPFRSKLFFRLFMVTTTALVGLFVVMYLVSVPFIQKNVERMEEGHAQTVLNNVVHLAEKIYYENENTRIATIVARKAALRDIISVVESRASWLQQQVNDGKMNFAQAKTMLLNEIRVIHYGNNDYIWASNYSSVLVSHPDPALNNADFSAKRDMRGNLIVPPMVAGGLAQGDGYHSYWWRRLGQEKQIEKLSYYKHFPYFKLVIGTGVYIDDIESAMLNRFATSIEELRQQLRNTPIARTGYIYLFNSQGHVIIHPNSNLEGKSLTGLIDPISKKELTPMLMAVANKPEGVRYKWDKPSDPGNYVYEKISWVRYFPDLDWYIGSSVYVDELTESAHILKQRMLMVFVVTLLLSIALVFLLVRRQVAPLEQLSVVAQEIEHGNLNARCVIQRDDEIGVVVTAFNGMVDRLQDSIQNLDAKISARTSELEKANEELKQLDQLKSDFLSTISHELRTPMTSVVGFAKLIKKKLEDVILPKTATDEKTARAITQVRGNLDIIVKESERLTLLINDVLDSAKLDAGKVEWKFVPLTAVSLLEHAAAVTSGLVAQKGLNMTFRAENGIPEIEGDGYRLHQVLINLISNALKFSEHGCIALRANQHNGFVRFSIQDSGVGIATDDQQTIFEKFHQIGNTLTDKPHGSGLGLSICRQIVEYHGGKIWVESALGNGSTFYFTIPISTSGKKHLS